jgi:hypothetical protein
MESHARKQNIYLTSEEQRIPIDHFLLLKIWGLNETLAVF